MFNPSFNCSDNSPHFPSDQNPNSPPFLFNFPSPFLDEHESPLSQIFLQNHQMAVNHGSPDQIHSNISDHPRKKDHVDHSKSGADDQELPTRVPAPLRRRSLGVVPRRRTGKKDRHSKICTAQGIRDRRMRLSLQVARKFFDLQDMLGYDKASKTIEWLFTKSKKAIKDLVDDIPQANNNLSMSDAKSESFLSECEVVSGLQEHASAKESKESAAPTTQTSQNLASKSNVKESREKARARARSRTREKMIVKGLENSHSELWCKPNPNQIGDFQKLGFPNSPIEGVDQESKCVSPYEASCNSLDQYPLADISTIERFLGNLSSSSSSWGNSMLSMQVAPGISEGCSAAVSDPNCSFMGFFGSWDSLNSGRTSSIYSVINQEYSFAGKPSSVYSAATEELP